MNQHVNSLIMNADENMGHVESSTVDEQLFQIGRASCRERV